MSAIKTISGIMIDPTAPTAEQIQIEDIAHALSMLCRANGHFKDFYSVGQHCIHCAQEAAARGYSFRVQLGCLLHDGSEAYLSDVTRPVKQVLPLYLEIEGPLQNAIWNKWVPELTSEEIRSIFQIDDELLYNEFLALGDMALVDPIPDLMTKPQFGFIGFQRTKEEYLRLFAELIEKL